MIYDTKTSLRGFTIVEVMMFLAISGLMISGLLLAVSGGINKERYNDATNSFIDFLKEQYNLVENVQNTRIPSDGGGPGADACTSAFRATSDCTIIGRYVASNNGMVTSWPIIATANVVEVLGRPGLDDSNSRVVYEHLGLVVSMDIGEMIREHTLRWQTRLVPPTNDADSELPREFRMVLLRSPLTGTVSTYVATSTGAGTAPAPAPDAANDVMNNSDTKKVYLCVDPTGLTSQKTGASIDPAGVNSSSVQFATAGECRGE